MKVKNIHYAGFYEISNNIMGISIFDGVEIDIGKAKEIGASLTERYGEEPFCILCNRMYRYSYTREALRELGRVENLLGIAVLVHGGVSFGLSQVHKLYQQNVKIFWTQKNAIAWLEEIINANKRIFYPAESRLNNYLSG